MLEENEVIKEPVKEPKESLFNQAGNALPLLTVIIISLGLVKQILYYSNFNVPIRYFIGITELGLLISNDLLAVFVVGLIVLITYRSVDTRNLPPNTVIIYHGDNVLAKIAAVCVLIASVVLYYLYAKDYPIKLMAISMFVLAAFMIAVCFFARPLYNHFNTAIKRILLIISFTAIFNILMKTGFEIKSVENGKYKGTIITTSDSTYTSTDCIYFIGKTESYVFIYNIKDSSTDIIPSGEVKNIKLKSW